MAHSSWSIPESWQEAAHLIVADRRPVRVMVVGAPDAGKTTFAAFLAEHARQAGRRVGAVDADVGQSSIGPPCVIGAGLARGPIARLSSIPLQMAYFVGDVSPSGHMLACLTGCKTLTDRLRARGAEVIIVDTSGLVLGQAGQELKRRKADLLRPHYIVVIQKGNELASLVALWRYGPWRLVTLPASPAARRREPTERRAWRTGRFRAFFRDARPIQLDLRSVLVTGTRLTQGEPLTAEEIATAQERLSVQVVHGRRAADGWTLLTDDWVARPRAQGLALAIGVPEVKCIAARALAGLICGLHDRAGRLIDLGLLQALELNDGVMSILAPHADPSRVGMVEIGRLRLKADGEELGRLRPGDL